MLRQSECSYPCLPWTSTFFLEGGGVGRISWGQVGQLGSYFQQSGATFPSVYLP